MNLNKLHNDIHEGALQLIAEHRVQLFAKAKSICDSDDEADELVTRTIDQAIRRIGTYAGKGNILSWMMTILVNIHNHDHRNPVVSGTRAVSVDELERYVGADWSTDERILKNSDSEAIRKAIADLDPKYNQVLLMRYYNEFSLKQIADLLRLPRTTIAWRLHVAHQLLAGKLGVVLGRTKKTLAILAAALTLVSAATAAVATVPALAPVRTAVAGWFADGDASGTGDSGTGVPPVQEDTGGTGVPSVQDGDRGTGVPPVQEDTGEADAPSVQPETVSVPTQNTPTTQLNKTRKGNAMSIKKIVSAALTAATSTLGLAGTINWTGEVDSDLSKPENWGVSALSGTDGATINVNNQTFTLDKNTSFSTMVLNSKVTAAAFDFSANPTNEIYLGATSGDAFKATGSSNLTLSFKGGVWRGTGDASFRAASDAYNNNSTTVFDGTIVTNFGTYTWGDHSKGQQRTELRNGTQVYVSSAYHYAAGTNAVLLLTGGSKLIAGNSVRTAYQGNSSAGMGFHKIIVEGEGSRLETGTGVSGTGLRLGDTYMGCSVMVTNRAALSSKGLNFGTHHNHLWMSNATVGLSGNYLNLNGTSNRVDLLDCDAAVGTLRLFGSYGRYCIRGNRGAINLPIFVNAEKTTYGSQNEVEVWDNVTGGVGSSPVGNGNRYQFKRTAYMTCTSAPGFGASNHEISLYGEGTTGGVFRYESSDAIKFGGLQTNCWLRLMDGISYEVPNASYYFGYKADNPVESQGHDNTIYVGTNATMSLLRFRTGNYGNRVIIDNGTFTTPEFSFDFANLTERAVSNSVVFAGTHPKFLYTLNATYSLPTTGGWYVFEVPPEGYEAAPLQVSKGLKIPDGAQVVVHADVEKLSRHFNGGGGLVPLMTGTSVTVSADKLAAMTQALGQPGARFVVKDNVLYLRVSARGMIIIL